MGGWWIADLLSDQTIDGRVWVVSWTVWVILSICLHELAHGWCAIKLGDDTPILAGHMTWNPMVHMGGFSLLMFLFIGIAWGAMPINPSKLRGRHSESLVAVAGPMMNLLLAIVALVLLVLWVPLTQGELISSVTISEPLATNMKTFLHLGAMLNIVLLLFNLLPVPPLDGGRIAMSFIPAYGRMLMSENGRWIVLGVFLLFFMFAGSILFALAGFSVNAVSHGVWAILFPNLSV
jgi:Zn-dependent protease